MQRVENKVAVVTGAASGLGKATAELLVAEGAKVLLTDINAEAGQAVAAAIEAKQPGSCRFMVQDVADPERWQTVIDQAIEAFGGLHILVNNAGIAAFGNIEEETVEGWRHTQSINLDAVFFGTQRAVIAMKQQGGSVINISSIEGLVGNPDIVAYNASKGGVRLLTKSAALYCAREGYPVRVNSIHPGFILTQMVKDGLDAVGPEAWEAVAADIPVGKMGEPADIAYAALYLASDESKYMTGSELVVDGGYTAR